MKDKKIFDILEDAEYDSMKRLIDKCPEISDEQLDRILVSSERKFRKQMKETEMADKDNNIKITENDAVEGVERSRRPAWLAPLSAAASIILIAGIAVGSAAMLSRNRIPDDGGITPAVTVTTSTGTGTTLVSAGKDGSAVTTTKTAAVSTTSAAQSDAGNNDEKSSDTEFIKPFTGKWKYQESSINNIDIPESITNLGIVEINSNATYTFTEADGSVSSGTIKKYIEEIGGTEILCLDFSGDSFIGHRAAYTESRPYELHFGNGNAARLIRDDHSEVSSTSGWKSAYRKVLVDFMTSDERNDESRWDLKDIDNDGTPELLISQNTYHISGVRVYYYENGNAVPVRDAEGKITEYGVYGEVFVCSEEHLLGVFNIHMGYEYQGIFQYSNHNITLIRRLGNDSGAVQTGDVKYTIDDDEVSENEYNKALNEINAKNWISSGRNYFIGDFSALE